MSSCVVSSNPSKFGVLGWVKPGGSTRRERAKEFDLDGPSASAVGQRIIERSGVEGSPDDQSITRFFAYFPHERGAEILTLFYVAAGNVPRSGERGERFGPAQEEHSALSKDRGTDADFGAQIAGHPRT